MFQKVKRILYDMALYEGMYDCLIDTLRLLIMYFLGGVLYTIIFSSQGLYVLPMVMGLIDIFTIIIGVRSTHASGPVYAIGVYGISLYLAIASLII